MSADILQVGDRVIIIKVIDEAEDQAEYNDSVVGSEGTISYVPHDQDALYDVDFEEPIGTKGFKSMRHHFYREEMERLR